MAQRFPRERGDGPHDETRLFARLWVFPASAGMDRPASAYRSRPRAFSPRARGWTVVAVDLGVEDDVFPASAGMDRPRREVGRPAVGFPRERGDGPTAKGRATDEQKFSPRARGWTVLAARRKHLGQRFPRERGDGPVIAALKQLKSAVFPASAGMDRFLTRWWTSCGCFPRERGDGPMVKPIYDWEENVFPASAGMDRSPDPGSQT